MTDNPENLLEMAYADPARARELGAAALHVLGEHTRERAVVLRAMSVASALLSDYEEAIRMAELARDTAIASGDDDERLLAALAMAGPLTVARSTREALDVIESVSGLATSPYLRARTSYQRGVTFMNMGEPVRAKEEFEKALPGLRAADDSLMVRSTLQNLGFLQIDAGELADAERALTEALEIARSRQEEPSISGIEHNLGRLAAYRGDLTEALALLMDSEEIFMRLTGSPAPQHVARCEVLLSAGLFQEASQLARQIAERNRAVGDPDHLANALLVGARATLAAGDFEEAKATAREAAGIYEKLGGRRDAMEARRIAIDAQYRLDGASAALMNTASDIASALEAERQVFVAAQARLLAGRIAIDLGQSDRALEHLDAVARIETGPVELRVHGRLARAMLRLARDDTRGAAAAVRSGLDLLDRYQAAIGATDMRLAIERQGAELAEMGLGLALRSGRPRRILEWMDRTRARALRHRPVVATGDDEVRGLLNSLRQVDARLRSADRQGDAALLSERRRLQERITRADRLKDAADPGRSGVATSTLIDALGHRGLLELGVVDGRVVGVLVRKGRARFFEVGDARTATRELTHARFAMRRAARRGMVVDRPVLERLDRSLFGEVDLTGSSEIVVVPPPQLMAAPWAALPTLREKTVVISPSAELWWRARQRQIEGDSVLVVGGIDLDVAESEVSAVGALYEGATVLPPGVGVEEVRSALAGRRVAHIASHATFQVENPMFSSLRLGDGDLNVYDIERLGEPPTTVVLSACDSGYTESAAGDELAGMTSALLSMGTRSVVASVGLVPDSPATSDLMVEFHRGLVDGLEPAQALSKVQADMLDDTQRFASAASFICVGA